MDSSVGRARPCISHQGENFFAKIFVSNLDSLSSFVNIKLYQAIGSQAIRSFFRELNLLPRTSSVHFSIKLSDFSRSNKYEFEFESVFFLKHIKLRNHHLHHLQLPINLDDSLVTFHA